MRNVEWEPSSAQPILEEIAIMIGFSKMEDLIFLIQNPPAIKTTVGSYPISCLQSNDELPDSCLDDES